MAMTAVELCELVAEMRRKQREYFRTKSTAALEESRRLERRADAAIEEVLRQGTLFT